MNPLPENTPPHGSANTGQDETRPASWCEALMNLIEARVALIQLEARATVRKRMSRVVGILIAAICMFFAWALLLVAGIAALSSASGWPWHWLAIVAAAIHVLLALILIRKSSTKPVVPAFPLTRAEFQKDRQWIENFQKKPKSNA